MTNEEGKTYEETIIASNKNEAEVKVKMTNPLSQIIDTIWVYK